MKKLTRAKVLTLEQAAKIDPAYSLEKTGITQSMMSGWLCCPLRGVLQTNRWSHADSARTTAFGTMFHDVLDKAYSRKTALDFHAVEQVVDELIAARDLWCGVIDEAEQEYLRGLVSVVAEAYFKHYEKDFSNKNFSRPEVTYAVQFNNVLLRGKVDGEYIDKSGAVWLMEHKTKGRIEEDKLMEKLSFDFQNLMYIVMWEIKNAPKKIKGTLYNVIRTPQNRWRDKPLNVTYDTIRKAIAADAAHYFKRWEVIYTEADKARFKRELADKLAYVRGFLNGTTNIYRNEFSCETPYACRFLTACASGQMAGYTQKPALFEELDV